jgi:hypothetical protein
MDVTSNLMKPSDPMATPTFERSALVISHLVKPRDPTPARTFEWFASSREKSLDRPTVHGLAIFTARDE